MIQQRSVSMRKMYPGKNWTSWVGTSIFGTLHRQDLLTITQKVRLFSQILYFRQSILWRSCRFDRKSYFVIITDFFYISFFLQFMRWFFFCWFNILTHLWANLTHLQSTLLHFFKLDEFVSNILIRFFVDLMMGNFSEKVTTFSDITMLLGSPTSSALLDTQHAHQMAEYHFYSAEKGYPMLDGNR